MPTSFFADLALRQQSAAPAGWTVWSCTSVETRIAARFLTGSIQPSRPLGPSDCVSWQMRVSRNQTKWSNWMRLGLWKGESATIPPRPWNGEVDGPIERVNIDVMETPADRSFRFVQARAVIHGDIQPWAACVTARESKAPEYLPSDLPDVQPDTVLVPTPMCQFDDVQLGSRLCSPTALAWAMNAVDKAHEGDSIVTASALQDLVYDADHDVFGNWVRAIFAAGVLKQPAKLRFFDNIAAAVAELAMGRVLVISVKYAADELPGSSLKDGTSGHLMALWGYDADECEALCMDPALPVETSWPHRYPIDALAKAWLGHGGAAYVLGGF